MTEIAAGFTCPYNDSSLLSQLSVTTVTQRKLPYFLDSSFFLVVSFPSHKDLSSHADNS
jgi:hypothetical protein